MRRNHMHNPRLSSTRATVLAIDRSTLTCIRYDSYNQEDSTVHTEYFNELALRKLLKVSVRAAFATLSSRRGAHPRALRLKKN